MPDRPETEDTPRLYHRRSAAAATKAIGRDGEEITHTAGYAVESDPCQLRRNRAGESFAVENPLNKRAISQYPFIAFHSLRHLLYLSPRSITSQQPASGKVGSLSSHESTLQEDNILSSGLLQSSVELLEHITGVLPGMKEIAHESSMTRVGIAGEISEVLDNPRSQRIEVDIADKLGEIGVFLTENRLVAILEELPVTVVLFVEAHGVAGKQTGHDGVKGCPPSLHEEMRVIAEKRPCVAGGMGIGEYLAHPFDEMILVDIITEDQSSFYAADDDMVEDVWGIQTGVAWHSPW